MHHPHCHPKRNQAQRGYDYVALLGILAAVSCKSMDPSWQHPNDTQLMTVTSAEHEVMLSRHNGDLYFFEICHKVHQTCTNAFRTSASTEHASGQALNFEMVQLETSSAALNEELSKQEIAELDRQLSELQTTLKTYEQDFKKEFAKEIDDYHQDPAKITSQDIQPFLQDRQQYYNRFASSLDYLSSPRFMGVAFLLSVPTQILHGILTGTLHKYARSYFAVAAMIGGVWLAVKALRFDPDSPQVTQVAFDKAVAARYTYIMKDFDELFERRYGDLVRSKQAEISSLTEQATTRKDQLKAAAGGARNKYPLVYQYQTSLTALDRDISTPMEPGTTYDLAKMLSQLATLLNSAIELEHPHADAMQTQGTTPKIARFCLPYEATSETTKVVCYAVPN